MSQKNHAVFRSRVSLFSVWNSTSSVQQHTWSEEHTHTHTPQRWWPTSSQWVYSNAEVDVKGISPCAVTWTVNSVRQRPAAGVRRKTCVFCWNGGCKFQREGVRKGSEGSGGVQQQTRRLQRPGAETWLTAGQTNTVRWRALRCLLLASINTSVMRKPSVWPLNDT